MEEEPLVREEDNETVRLLPSIADLPNHILVDILSRLPIKSLISCRCVCKPFLSLLSLDPEFPRLHLSRSPAEVILCPPYSGKIFLIDSDADRVHKLKLRFGGSADLAVVNSSRGLICLRLPDSDPVCVLNPITLEFTPIPAPAQEHERCYSSRVVIGFGYSPKTDKYKVLRILFPHIELNSNHNCCVTEIYTLGTRSWRRIGNAPIFVSRDFFPAFLNGALHWVIDENDSSGTTSDYMISFDFDEEKFGEIALPPPFDISQERDSVPVLSIGAFRGCLCVCVWSRYDRVDVWVMKEYGARESWFKEFVVKTPRLYWPEGSFPVKYLNDGEVLMFHADYGLVTYNTLEKNIVKYLKFIGFPPDDSEAKAITHVPILIPLKELVIGAEVHLLTGRQLQSFRDLSVVL